MTHAGDGSGRLFVVEKPGRIKVVVNGQVQATPFLDIDPLVYSGGSEQGLLGLAFHPNYATNGRFYVFYTDEAEQDDILARYQRAAGDPPGRIRPAGGSCSTSRTRTATTTAGCWRSARTGTCTSGLATAAAPATPRTTPRTSAAARQAAAAGRRCGVDAAPYYEIPPSNPYATRTDGTRREIWASGLRNPWRFSFDRQTGDLCIGDVGQGSREEINRQPAGSGGGQNYGWRIMEGLTATTRAVAATRAG